MRDARQVGAAVIEAVALAVDDDFPIILRDLAIGAGEARADLAIMADEFIGVALLGAEDGPDEGDERLRVYERCFDRVALAAPRALAGQVRIDDASPAAVWAVDDEGGLAELRPGGVTRASISGYFDLISLDERRRVLARLTGADPVRARGRSTVEQVRREIAAELAARA